MINILKVINFAKENNLRLTTDEGLVISNSKGYVVFYDRDILKCFNNAAKWIDNRK